MNQELEELEQITGPNFRGQGPADIVNALVPILFGFAGILLILYMLWGGILLMTSQGDPKKTQEAKGKITGGIIGIVLVLFAFLIVEALGSFFGIDSLTTVFGGGGNAGGR